VPKIAGSTSCQSLLGRFVKLADLLAPERKHPDVGEQVAVEPEHFGANRSGECTIIHRPPQVGDKRHELVRVIAAIVEQTAKGFFRKQLDAGGEHREQAAHQELRDLLRRVFLGLQRFRNLRQPPGNVAGDSRACAGRIERLRIEPDRPQPLAHLGFAQVFKIDAEILPIRKLRIVFSLPGEIRIDLDAVPDIANKNERRPAMRRRQRAGIFFRLPLGIDHQDVPGAAGAWLAALGCIGLGGEEIVLPGDGLVAALPSALFGFEDE
jgi:hypothetical protein